MCGLSCEQYIEITTLISLITHLTPQALHLSPRQLYQNLYRRIHTDTRRDELQIQECERGALGARGRSHAQFKYNVHVIARMRSTLTAAKTVRKTKQLESPDFKFFIQSLFHISAQAHSYISYRSFKHGLGIISAIHRLGICGHFS